MTVKKKILLSITVAIVLVTCTFFFIAPRAYVAIKYKVDITQVQIVKCIPAGIHNNLAHGALPFEPYFDNAHWQMKYNGRVFNVDHIGWRLYDDYQLEDLVQWCTEYFQEHVDGRIDSIYFQGRDIYKFNLLGINRVLSHDDTVWEKSDIEEYIYKQGDNSFMIYVLDDDVYNMYKDKDDYEFEVYQENLMNEYNAKLSRPLIGQVSINNSKAKFGRVHYETCYDREDYDCIYDREYEKQADYYIW